MAGTQTEEVRLAMGWNGGVSLAVWMGGVAVELDCARRADVGLEDDTTPHRVIYNALCEAFDRRLVLDIFAGASAGGLNSALLGAAIFERRRLHPDFLRARWLDLGDFEGLLQPTNKPAPTSIMQGDLFARAMTEAFEELMTARQNATPDKPDLCALPPKQSAVTSFRPLLDIQATNVIGKQRGFVDAWGHRLVAREYRAPFRFREDAHFKPKILAAAARASASFPAAFEPFRLEEDVLEVAGLSAAARFGGVGESLGESAIHARYAIDGGVLENAPIRQAIELIPSRPASGPVKRFVCYVNANPSRAVEDDADPIAPGLTDVLGYVVNLPRVGRDIDQLDAITAAARRGAANADTVSALLLVPQDALLATATALFEPYRKRRAFGSIEVLLTTPATPAPFEAVQRVMAATADGALLPWLPDGLEAPQTATDWRWGFRAAQRILYLQLDIFGGALRAAAKTDAFAAVSETVYAARGPIDEAIASMELAYQRFIAEPGLAARLQAIPMPINPTAADENQRKEAFEILNAIFDTYRDDNIYRPLATATESFYEAVRTLHAAGAFPYPVDNLFGAPPGGEAKDGQPVQLPPDLSPSALRHFFERALAIEVVRRALVDDNDIDSAQTLLFTQLAPNVPVRIFTETPVRTTGPADGDDKLTGIRLGHFAGFYRRSWRANDFMWGRLDGAARIVDLLVDRDWQLRLGPAAAPWTRLAEALVPTGADASATDRRTLVREALLDARTEAADVPTTVSNALSAGDIPGPEPQAADSLRALVSETLKTDLTAPPAPAWGFLTRVLLARAAQYEVLRQELPVLVHETVGDRDLGGATQPLTWQTDDSLLPAIRDLRSYDGKNALPRRLGRDSGDESASTLALRTVAHAALVTLAALPGVSMPLARVTTPARLPFLSIAGVAARSLLANLAVVVAFGAAAFYLTARIVTSDNSGKHPVLLGEIISPPVIAMFVAIFVVLGVLLIPLWRAARTSKRLWNALWAAALALSAGGIAIAAGVATIGTAQTLTGSGGFNPGTWVTMAIFIGAGVGVGAVRHVKPLEKALAKFTQGRSWATSLVSLAAAGVVLGWSSTHVVRALNDGSWHTVAAAAALASMPLLVAYAFAVQWTKAASAHLRWLGARMRGKTRA